MPVDMWRTGTVNGEEMSAGAGKKFRMMRWLNMLHVYRTVFHAQCGDAG